MLILKVDVRYPLQAMLLADNRIQLEGRVGSVDGQTLLKAQVAGDAAEAEHLGVVLAQELLAQGAGDLLKAFYH